jgi:hypothetical protein
MATIRKRLNNITNIMDQQLFHLPSERLTKVEINLVRYLKITFNGVLPSFEEFKMECVGYAMRYDISIQDAYYADLYSTLKLTYEISDSDNSDGLKLPQCDIM